MFIVAVGAQRETRMLRVSLRINNKHKASHLLCFVDNSWRCNLFSLEGYMHCCKDSVFQSFFVSNSWSTSIVRILIISSSTLPTAFSPVRPRQPPDQRWGCPPHPPPPSHASPQPRNRRQSRSPETQILGTFSGSQTWKRIFRAQTVSGDASFHLTRSLW